MKSNTGESRGGEEEEEEEDEEVGALGREEVIHGSCADLHPPPPHLLSKGTAVHGQWLHHLPQLSSSPTTGISHYTPSIHTLSGEGQTNKQTNK